MFALVLLFMCGCAHAQIQVNTSEGVVIGQTATEGGYYVFYGIPYAGSTSGENRFKAPSPPPVRPGPLSATDSNIICAHLGERGLVGIEDCLTLNIYTKNTTTPKPVLVWINGEEYATVNTVAQYSFRSFIDEDILMVTLNYRLSIFGFLCLGVSDAPGNAGLKDIVQALKWIKQNIQGFGGDPNNVTLLGHGSGAAMVDLVTMSPLAENLAHKAIVLSGSALSPWAVAYNPINYAQAVGDKLAYSGQSNEELAKHLIKTDLGLLMTVLGDFMFTNNTVLFAPCVENVKLNPNSTFLSDAPINILRSGSYSQIPYLAGYTNKEGTIKAREAAVGSWLTMINNNFTAFLPADLKFTQESDRANISKEINLYYFLEQTASMGNIDDYLDYMGDSMILVPVIRGVKERAMTSKSPVRLFEFTYMGTFNSDWTYTQIRLSGVRHGGILNYLFNFDLRQADESARRGLVKRFTDFVKLSEIDNNPPNVLWEPVTSQFINYIYFAGGDGAVANLTSVFTESHRVNPHTQRMDFWDAILRKYYDPPRPVSSADKFVAISLLLLVSQLLNLLI